MPFQYVLANLLADNPDAEAALFLDDAGETVDFACAEQSPYEMRLLGAYLGIYLRLIGGMLSEARLGATRLFHIERAYTIFYGFDFTGDDGHRRTQLVGNIGQPTLA